MIYSYVLHSQQTTNGQETESGREKRTDTRFIIADLGEFD